MLNIITLPYHRALYYYTIDPLRALALGPQSARDELFTSWRIAKLHELRFVQVSVSTCSCSLLSFLFHCFLPMDRPLKILGRPQSLQVQLWAALAGQQWISGTGPPELAGQ